MDISARRASFVDISMEMASIRSKMSGIYVLSIESHALGHIGNMPEALSKYLFGCTASSHRLSARMFLASFSAAISLCTNIQPLWAENSSTSNASLESLAKSAARAAAGRNYDLAEAIYKQCVTIAERNVDQPDCLIDSLENLAGMYEQTGRKSDASRAYEQSLRIAEQHLGPENAGTTAILDHLATLYTDQHHYERAEHVVSRALSLRIEALGPTHRETSDTREFLARTLARLGKYTEAAQQYQQEIAVLERSGNLDSVPVLDILEQEAHDWRLAGNLKEAIQCLQKLIILGEKNHPEKTIRLTMRAHLVLSEIYGMQNKLRECEAELTTAWIKADQISPPAKQLIAWNDIGYSCSVRRCFTKAVQCYQKSLSICRLKLPREDQLAATAMQNLGIALNSAELPLDAERQFKASLVLQEKCTGRSSIEAAYIHYLLACTITPRPLCQIRAEYKRCADIVLTTPPSLVPDPSHVAPWVFETANIFSAIDRKLARKLYTRSLELSTRSDGPHCAISVRTAKALTELDQGKD